MPEDEHLCILLYLSDFTARLLTASPALFLGLSLTSSASSLAWIRERQLCSTLCSARAPPPFSSSSTFCLLCLLRPATCSRWTYSRADWRKTVAKQKVAKDKSESASRRSCDKLMRPNATFADDFEIAPIGMHSTLGLSIHVDNLPDSE